LSVIDDPFRSGLLNATPVANIKTPIEGWGKILRASRRDFVKLLTSSGIALSVSRLALAEEPDFAARETLPGRQNWNPAATGAGRIDGVVKVTGSKLYAGGDFRAADLPGWPASDSTMALGEIGPSTTGSGALTSRGERPCIRTA